MSYHRREYRVHVRVETPAGDEKCVSFLVAAFMASGAKWAAYDLCSDSVTASIVGGVTELGAARIDAEREKLAAEVSSKITAHIMKMLKARDLRNGYPQSDDKQAANTH